MDALNNWAVNTLGQWVTDFAALFLIIAAGLFVILLLTFIIVGISRSKTKKKLKAYKDGNAKLAAEAAGTEKDNGELRAEIRAELEPIIREQLAAEYNSGANADYAEQNMAMARKIDELNDSVRDKQNTIDRLSAALEQANSAHKSDNSGLYRTINELNQTVKEQQNEINLLKAENSQIKAQALQQQLAGTSRPAAASAARPAPARATARPAAAAKPAAAPVETAKPKKPPVVEEPEDDDDEYDEYYDDYGDETSAVKVTLKFDRVKNNWVILRTDTDRAYRRLATKQEALVVAKDLARRLHAQLVVHKKDGKFQRI